jgi:hypothetical protein
MSCGFAYQSPNHQFQPTPPARLNSNGLAMTTEGNCYALTYRSGAQYLLLIKAGTPYWAPLAPTNEQVQGEDDAWVSWVRNAAGVVANRPD